MSASCLAEAPQDARTHSDLRDDLSSVNLILVCSSLGQECGIARYTQYVAEALRQSVQTLQVTSDSGAALQIAKELRGECVVLLQHEYGLFDYNSAIGGKETTSDVIGNLRKIQELGPLYRVGILMHSIVLHDHVLNSLNKQWFSAGIPLFSLNREGAAAACVNYIEHGARVSAKLPHQASPEFGIGAFGLLSPNKDVESVLQLCSATQSPIHANYASHDIDAIDRVTHRMRELGVDGCVRFDFLPEEELLEFLQESSIIYLPQHDFEHFATSGSARFALSSHRAVITPPHRAFHDLAGSVYFADLTEAIDEVRKLKSSELRMRAHLVGREGYLQRSNLLSVYSVLLRRLREDDVWTGGKWNTDLAPVDLTEAGLDSALIAAGPLAPQERACFRQNGIGMLRGDFVQTRPDLPAVFDNDMTDLLIPPSAPTTDIGSVLMREFETSGPVAQCVLREQEATLGSFLQSGLADPRRSKSILRLLRTPGSYLSAIVFLQYPLLFQVLILSIEFNVSKQDVLSYASRSQEPHANSFTSQGLEIPVIASAMALRTLCARYPLLAAQTVWGLVPFPGKHDRHQIIFPAALLTFESEMFVLALYRVTLHREPDESGFRHHLDALKQGASKATLAHGMAQTDEARRCGILLDGDVFHWQEIEVQIADDLLRCAALAPAGDRMLCDNLSYLARNSNGALLDRLRSSIPGL